MPIEFFLPDRLMQQLITHYNETKDNKNKGLLFTVDFEQDAITHIYGAKGTVEVAAGDANNAKGLMPNVSATVQVLCPHPPPCG